MQKRLLLNEIRPEAVHIPATFVPVAVQALQFRPCIWAQTLCYSDACCAIPSDKVCEVHSPQADNSDSPRSHP